MAKTKEQIIGRGRQRVRRQRRVRRRVQGTAERPRLTVFRSNRGIFAQVIDDLEGKTMVSASSREVKDAGLDKSKMAEKVGEILAGRAKEKNIEKIVFDRGGYLYHGRVKALAEGVRKGGLDF
ncbi:MAG: 50S ribosomal protein L18 [Thermoleophilia bacterium]|nr:50S ribosomal protein L18 [Thermoleophilia bacterium]